MNKLDSYKPKKHRRWLTLLILIPILVLAGGYVAYKKIYTDNLAAVSASSTEEVAFTVESGQSVRQIAKNLKSKNLIKSDWAFGEYVRSNGYSNSIKAGTYKLKKSYDVAKIVELLKDGKVAIDLFTILPAQRLDQIRASLVDKGGFSAVEAEKALEPSQYSSHPALSEKPKNASLEGYLYPDSYQITGTTKAEDIVRQALSEMADALTTDIRAKFKQQGLTTHEAVTLASIVEKEIPANPNTTSEDRQKAAQVFLKRKSIGMMLGSDVTACYGAIMAGAMKTGDNCDNFVYYKSNYNTRLLTGLPPGPISNVSKSSLGSIANPASTGYLFFVAGKDCVTRFSNTNAEHEALVDKYGLSTQGGDCN